MSQPVDSQACLSSGELQCHEAGHATQLSLSADQASFVGLKTSSPYEREKNCDSQETVILTPSSQVLFESPPGDKGSYGSDSNSQEGQIMPPKKRAKFTLESQSQDSSSSQDRDSSKSVKTKVLPNGKVLKYAYCKIVYCDANGAIIHSESAGDLSPSSSSQSSGYLADSGSHSSGTSSGSQDLILKAHRSSDDVFLSPAVPKLRETKSSSPPDASKNTQLSKLPKPDNHLKALVSQQRHHILAAVNGNRQRHFSHEGKEHQNSATSNQTNGEGDVSNADTEPLYESQHTAPIRLGAVSQALNKPTKRKKRNVKCKPAAYPYRSARNIPAPQGAELVAGARVLGRWPADGHYYFGRVAQKVPGIDRWQVVFDDNNALIISKKDLLVTQHIPRQHPVYALNADEEYQLAVVLDKEDGLYTVSFVNNDSPSEHRVSPGGICLDADQFNNLKISLLTHSQLYSSDEASQSNFLHANKDAASARLTDEIGRNSLLSPEKIAKAPELFCGIQKSPIKATSSKSKKLEPSDGACSSLTFGQSSTNNLKVFDGMLFMCTHLCRNKSVDRIMSKTSIQDTDDTQAEDDEEEDIDANEVCAQIEALGGVVIDSFDADAVQVARRTFLISTGFQRTVKYLQCLAANVLPVSYHWVRQCFKEKKYLKETDFILPAGIDISGNVVEWATRTKTIQERSPPFKDVSVYIDAIESEPSFSVDWKAILTIAGAMVLPKISINSGVRPQFILTKAGCEAKSTLNRAQKLAIPIASPEWAIQRLITGIKYQPSFHAAFQILTSDATEHNI